MWRRSATASALAGLLLASAASWALAAPNMLPGEIVQDAVQLDGYEVSFQGEVIGDRLHSGTGHVWINVLGEDSTALGVWVVRAETEDIGTFGDYEHRGDTVEVAGILNAACDLHGGDLDVHALEFGILASGEELHHDVQPLWAILGLAFIAGAAVLWRVARHLRLRAPGIAER